MESLSIVRPHRLGTLPVRRFRYFVSYGNSEAVAFVPTSENFLTKVEVVSYFLPKHCLQCRHGTRLSVAL